MHASKQQYPETTTTAMAAPMDDSVGSEEKLYFLHERIDLLRKEAIDKKLSCIQIKKAAKPFLTQSDRNKTSACFKLALVVACLSCFVGLFYSEAVYRKIKLLQRTFMVMVLPVLDWTVLHGIPCAIPNLFSQDQDRILQPEDCQKCLRISEVPSLLSPSMEEVANGYLDSDLPLLVLPESQSIRISMQDIIKLYLDDEVMYLYTSCDFKSNLNIPKNDHRNFLEGVKEGKHGQFYAHWENCFKESAKLFRKVYKRPDFLPTSVELIPANWILLCSNFTQRDSVKLPFLEQVIILLQMSGSLEVTLKPRDLCSKQCHTLHTIIPEGSALIMTDFFYDLEYSTCAGDSSVTVGLVGKLDL